MKPGSVEEGDWEKNTFDLYATVKQLCNEREKQRVNFNLLCTRAKVLLPLLNIADLIIEVEDGE